MKVVNLLLAVCCLVAISSSHGYKILGVFPTQARSHYIVGSTLMKSLAAKGHDVTMIAPFGEKKPLKNYRSILSKKADSASNPLIDNLLSRQKKPIISRWLSIYDLGINITRALFEDKSVNEFLNSKDSFDVVICEIFLDEAILGLGQYFNAPIIGVSIFGASTWTTDLVGTPSPPSFVPHPFLSFSDRMTFIQRASNLAMYTLERLFLDYYYLPRQQKLYDEFFVDPKPDFYSMRKNVSLVLLNSHVSLGYSRPYSPNMIEIGGINVNRNRNDLPENIKSFLDSATDGAIYFSMGSNLKSSQLPKEKLSALLETVKSLKQKVLWKWEETNLPGKSDNILISDWFPQDDILAHPNVKLFITHGGLLSTTESIYHGVPFVGIPMFGDQFLNMARAEQAGYGLTVDFNTISRESMTKAITEVINNPSFAQKLKIRSAVFKDQPKTPMDTAIYWVEYVARHKGAPHLQSGGQHLNFIEYHNLDVFGILFVGLVVVIYLIRLLIKTLCRLVCGSQISDKHIKSIKKTKLKPQ